MHLKSRVILGAATAATAIGAALIPATMAAAAAPALTVTVNEPTGFNAQDGSTVTVVGSGYTANAQIAIVECSAVDHGQAGCNVAGYKLTTADANGGFTVSDFVVHTGAIGDGKCGANSTCYVAAANAANQAEQAANTFQFDRLQVSPRTGLRNGQKLTISGAGFKPSTTVYVSECTGSDPTKATQDCQTSAPALQTYPTDANGAFGPVSFTVVTGRLNADGSKCDVGKSCIIAASDNILNPGDPSAHIGGAVVKFAAVKPLSVTARASVGHIGKGKTFKVTGSAKSGSSGVPGLTAVLDKVVNGSLQKVASVKTGSSGSILFKIAQQKTTTYKVVISAQKGYAKAASKTFKVATP